MSLIHSTPSATPSLPIVSLQSSTIRLQPDQNDGIEVFHYHAAYTFAIDSVAVYNDLNGQDSDGIIGYSHLGGTLYELGTPGPSTTVGYKNGDLVQTTALLVARSQDQFNPTSDVLRLTSLEARSLTDDASSQSRTEALLSLLA